MLPRPASPPPRAAGALRGMPALTPDTRHLPPDTRTYAILAGSSHTT